MAPVTRHGPHLWLKLLAGGAAALLLVVAITWSVNRYRTPASAPPEALERIAEKNREAATIAAASQRAESAESTNAVEDLAEAQRLGEREVNATRDRLDDRDNRAAPSGNSS